jgi:tRNA (Thr-GGU) A37 N-methylase
LLAVDDKGITVRGLDALDGTPVLDIKPYIPGFERKDNVRLPGWVDKMMDGYF